MSANIVDLLDFDAEKPASVETWALVHFSNHMGIRDAIQRKNGVNLTVRSIYPDGFLPFIKSDIDDGSFSMGLKGDAKGWKWDLGTVYGHNSFDFGIDNSARLSRIPQRRSTWRLNRETPRPATAIPKVLALTAKPIAAGETP